jgi:hypothetical protein
VDFLRRGCKYRRSSSVAISALATRPDTHRLSRSVARERMRPIVIGPSPPMPERDRAAVEGRAMTKASVRAAPVGRLPDHWERSIAASRTAALGRLCRAMR